MLSPPIPNGPQYHYGPYRKPMGGHVHARVLVVHLVNRYSGIERQHQGKVVTWSPSRASLWCMMRISQGTPRRSGLRRALSGATHTEVDG